MGYVSQEGDKNNFGETSGKVDGRAGGSYLIGKETKEKQELLSTLRENGLPILTIKVRTFDHMIVDCFIKMIKKKHQKDISKDKKALGKLRRECERAKRALSTQHQSPFRGVEQRLVQKTMGSVKKAMDDAGLQKNQIHEIVIVGGSTRIPKGHFEILSLGGSYLVNEEVLNMEVQKPKQSSKKTAQRQICEA
ncbi:unnamed protein product, partial [Thlaspi arvense]